MHDGSHSGTGSSSSGGDSAGYFPTTNGLPPYMQPGPAFATNGGPRDQEGKKDIDALKYKTKACQHWIACGQCPYNEKCMFAHGDIDLRTITQNSFAGLQTEYDVRQLRRVCGGDGPSLRPLGNLGVGDGGNPRTAPRTQQQPSSPPDPLSLPGALWEHMQKVHHQSRQPSRRDSPPEECETSVTSQPGTVASGGCHAGYGQHPPHYGSQPPAAIEEVKYKTTLCRNWVTAGACPYNEKCMFAHGVMEIRTVTTNIDQRENDVMRSFTPKHSPVHPAATTPVAPPPVQLRSPDGWHQGMPPNPADGVAGRSPLLSPGAVSTDDGKSIDTKKFKTSLCRNWVAKGSCPYYEKCMFAHGDHELRAPGSATHADVRQYRRAATEMPPGGSPMLEARTPPFLMVRQESCQSANGGQFDAFTLPESVTPPKGPDDTNEASLWANDGDERALENLVRDIVSLHSNGVTPTAPTVTTFPS